MFEEMTVQKNQRTCAPYRHVWDSPEQKQHRYSDETRVVLTTILPMHLHGHVRFEGRFQPLIRCSDVIYFRLYRLPVMDVSLPISSTFWLPYMVESIETRRKVHCHVFQIPTRFSPQVLEIPFTRLPLFVELHIIRRGTKMIVH